MGRSYRHETRPEAARCDLSATADALRAEPRVTPLRAPRRLPVSVLPAFQASPGLRRLPLVQSILADLRKAARSGR